MVKIVGVERGSFAYKHGITAGDILVSINGNEINDVLDYRFYLTEIKVVVEYKRGDEMLCATIVKDEYDDIGLDFETPLMDKKHTCKNGCVFCFIDQNPDGLRESLYFKDDDSRLSFLHGNYITLTNMCDADVARIVKMKFSPINISVHTTNPELRVKMMKNKRAGDVLKYLDDFKNAGLSMCAQIVLCRGLNDGFELERTMTDLSKYFPQLVSVAVVPAGLTKFRDGLYPLTDFSAQEAANVIDTVNSFGEKFMKKNGTRLIYAADEFYLKAGQKIPETEYYEDYSQIENGVGMIRSFVDEFLDGIDDVAAEIESPINRHVTVVTGQAAYPMISMICEEIENKIPGSHIDVYEIKNSFFGESITVTGLLTGKDIAEQLSDKNIGAEILLPENCLRQGEDVFLCGMTVPELSEKLGVPVKIVKVNGFDFIDAVLGV